MLINRDEYVSRVLGCWLGKNIGGTLGAPFEWKRQINDVTFYTQDLGGESAVIFAKEPHLAGMKIDIPLRRHLPRGHAPR